MTAARPSPDRARELAARAFDDALHACEMSGRCLAEHLGVTEAVVRRWRSGERPISAGTILRLPTTVRVEYLARLEATAGAAAPRPRPEVSALLIVGRAAELTAALALALGDGHMTEVELDALRPFISWFLRVLTPLRAVGDA